MGPMASSNTSSTTPISTDCSGCGELITDRFILQVAGRSWHAHCLRCCVCHTLLDGHASCFLRDEQLYCKLDYTKLFGAKCYKCGRMISPADWVRKAKDQVHTKTSKLVFGRNAKTSFPKSAKTKACAHRASCV